MTCKTQYNHKTLLGTKQLSRHPDAAIPLRSARDRVARRNRIARHCCRTHHWDAPVPMHKVSQHMRNTISQQQQRREKVTRNPQFHCARISSKIPRQRDDARDRRAREPTFLRNGTSVHPGKHNVSQDTTGNQVPFWASENATSWPLKAHANWAQWSLGVEKVTSWSPKAHANWTQRSLGIEKVTSWSPNANWTQRSWG